MLGLRRFVGNLESVSFRIFYACSKCRHDDFNRVTVLFKCYLCVKWGRVTRRVQIPASGFHDDVIKWKHFPRYWPFVRGFHRSRWISRTKASDAELWCFFFICARINDWVNNREAGDLRRHRPHYDVIVMETGMAGSRTCVSISIQEHSFAESGVYGFLAIHRAAWKKAYFA